MPYRHLRPRLIEFVWEVDDQTFSTVAVDMDMAFEMASEEAAMRGLHDAPLRCVDQMPYDPSGGDGDDE